MLKRRCTEGLITAQSRPWLRFSLHCSVTSGITANLQPIISLRFLLKFSLRCRRRRLGFQFALIGFNLQMFVRPGVHACSWCASALTSRLAHVTRVRYNLVRIPGRPLVQQLPFILHYFTLLENDYVQPAEHEAWQLRHQEAH